MRILKTRVFVEWAVSERLSDAELLAAINEMEEGLFDAALGGSLYKKRVALQGRGKRGGARTLIAYRAATVAVFLVGFSKGERANISAKELKALRRLAKELMGYSEQGWVRALAAGKLIEVTENDPEN